jgi:hypothetical protein
MYSYIHWSEVTSHWPGTIDSSTADRIASVLGLEAFQYSFNHQWYALDEDGDVCIALTNDLAIAMHSFSLESQASSCNFFHS